MKAIYSQLKSIPSKSLILIFLAVAALVISSALIELDQSKRETYELMARQSHSLLETTLAASRNALLTYEELETVLKDRLLDNANLIRLLYERNQITNELLEKIAEENKIFRINIFNKNGIKIFSSHKEIHTDLEEKNNPAETLEPIFQDETDTLFIGIKKARYEPGYRFALALAAKNRSAIVLNLNAEEILSFKEKIGFGILLKNLTKDKGIIYAALQDTSGVIAASGLIPDFEDIYTSGFLTNSLSDSIFKWREIKFDSVEVFEAVHPFDYKNYKIGLLRLGLSLEPLDSINERIGRRIIIIGIILFALGSLLITYVFAKQNIQILKKQYREIEIYSNSIIENVNDGVVVLDEDNKIKIFNSAAESLFNKKREAIVNNNLDTIFEEKNCGDLLNPEISVSQLECQLGDKSKYLLVSKSTFTTEDKKQNTIYVIRDLTKQKILEDRIQRKERLVAMGELASGVAHEIRNPLNTIGIIIQQLEKDFEPVQRKDEYYSLAKLVRREVKRINDTVHSFLRFSKPEPVFPVNFQLSELLAFLKEQYEPMLNEKNIQFLIDQNWRGEVFWDRNQIQQVLMNLIQNSFDSIEEGGQIKIAVNKNSSDQIEIKLSDTGKGISENIKNKIFNLYFTTKAKGTGIGLSIVQRIIYEHNGIISLESTLGKGTEFKIELPEKVIIEKPNK